MSSKGNLTKEERISKEIQRLNRILKNIDKNKKGIAEGLICEAAFMRETLAELKDRVNLEGSIIEMPQGKYSITVEAPWNKAYNSMIQRYNATMEKLFGLLPKELAIKNEDDGFEEFVINK